MDKFFLIRCLRFLHLGWATLTVCPLLALLLLLSSPPPHCVHNCVSRPLIREISPKKYCKLIDTLKYEFKGGAKKCHGNLQELEYRIF